MKNELAKARPDAWDAQLTEEQRWQVFAQLRRCPWYEVAKWAAEEFGIAAPSRSGIYRWHARMRTLESAHRVEQAILARKEAGELAEAGGQADDQRVAAYQSLAQDIALRTGDAKTANTYVTMAMMIAAGQSKRHELDLRARAQATKDETLRLAREKFESAERRIDAAKGVMSDTALTPAERDHRLRELFGLRPTVSVSPCLCEKSLTEAQSPQSDPAQPPNREPPQPSQPAHP